MSQTVRILTEKPPVLIRPRSCLSTPVATGSFPGFVPDTSFDVSLPSRREALQQFHRFEMMAEVEGRLRAESGLVRSEAGGDSDDAGSQWETAAAAALHDAREELAGHTLHVDPHRMDDVWSTARREAELEEGPDMGEVDAVFIAHQTAFTGQDDALEKNSHTRIMEDLGKLRCRMEQIRTRQLRHWGSCQPLGSLAQGDDDGSDAFLVSEALDFWSENWEFDPEHYIEPLLRNSDVMDGADLRLQHSVDESNRDAVRRTTLREIFSDPASVEEAMQLLQFSIGSNRPDVVACVRRCQEEQRQHHPITTITNLPAKHSVVCIKEPEITTADTRRTRKVRVVEKEVDTGERAESCGKEPKREPSMISLAEMVTRTLPTIPDELRNELANQRQLLERLAATQEANFRQLAQERQEAARRRLTAPRMDPLQVPLVSSSLTKPETLEIAGAPQGRKKVQERALPPVITITTMRPQSPVSLRPEPPLLPPYYMEELGRLHRQYENLLRDERRAWTDIMKKQRDSFEMEKRATVEAMRCAAVQRQHEDTEGIKRVIAEQEVKRQRLQHVAEVKQQQAFQHMLNMAMSSGRGGVTTATPSKPRRPLQSLSQRGKQPPFKRKRAVPEVGKSNERKDDDDGDEAKQARKKKSPKLKSSVVKGPYRVVLPDEEPKTPPDAASLDASLPLVDATVVPSHEENKEDSNIRLPYKTTKGGARVYAGWKRRDTSLPAGNRVAMQRSQRSPYASSARRLTDAATGAARRVSTSPRTRNLKPCRPLPNTKVCEASSHAFSLKDHSAVTKRMFCNTAESVLTGSFHSSKEVFSPSPPVAENASCLFRDNTGTNADPQAIFPRSILVLSDPLTSEEMARRRSIERDHDDSFLIPSLSPEKGGGTQQPCDMHHAGEEQGDMTPRRRAQLRAMEAQTRMEARRRLDRIRDLSLTPRPKLLGEPTQQFQHELNTEVENKRRLTDLLANETIHCIIGEEAEKSLFADLFQELERDLVRSELHRLASRDMETTGEGKVERQVHEKLDGIDGIQMEQVVTRACPSYIPLNEEFSLEETIARHMTEVLLQSVLQPTSENENESALEERRSGVMTPVSHEIPPHTPLEEVSEATQKPLWVRERISVTTDPLWRTPEKEEKRERKEEVVMDRPCETPLVSAPQSGVVLAAEGAGGSVRTDATGAIRIIVDVAPVMRHLTAAALPVTLHSSSTPPLPISQLQQEKHGSTIKDCVIASEERRLLCATEEDLLFCEVVDAPVTTSAGAGLGGDKERPKNGEETTSVPCVALEKDQYEEIFLPDEEEDAGVPQPLLSAPGDTTLEAGSLLQQQRYYLELVHQKESCRCQEDEALQRLMFEEQESMIRAMWPMMWNLHQAKVAMPHEPRKLCASPEHLISPAVSFTDKVVDEVRSHEDKLLPPVPSSSGIRDPITRFIFEWMHEYNEKRKEELTPKNFVEKLHEASQMAEGKQGSSVDLKVCRSLPPSMRQLASSSSWLSSTDPSSVHDGKFARFVTASRDHATRVYRTYRRSDEKPSSRTTETTRYTNLSFSPVWPGQEACGGDKVSSPTKPLMSTENNTTSTTMTTTTTTTSTNRTWLSNESAEKPRLRDTMLRRLRQIQSKGQPQEKPLQHLEESPAAAVDVRRQLFSDEQQLNRAHSLVASVPLEHRPHWW